MKTVIEMAREAGMLVPRPYSVSNEENQMDDLMLPLPEPFIGTKFVDNTSTAWDTFEFYTADQLREYAKKAVEAEREACAKVCETTAPSQINGYECADAIRARSKDEK